MATLAHDPDAVETTIDYLVSTSHINRRFWAPGEEYNTGTYASNAVTVRNARTAAHPPTLDVHGFTLASYPTDIEDFLDTAVVNSSYAQEVTHIAREMTGADLVVPMGGQVRSPNITKGVQPPAAEAHVDFNTPTSNKVAEMLYRRAQPDGPGYDRFILFSLWRATSPGPQDWPLALCDFDSAKDDADVPNVKVDVDTIPTGDALFAPIEGEEDMMAASIFHHNPAHRWWYYPDMTRDEVIFIKFHDSNHGRAWRALHTAFHDKNRPNTVPRASIEFRACAFFTKK